MRELRPAQWRQEVHARAGEKCERCKAAEDPRPDGGTYRHHCHHKDRDRTNNTLENGEYLCGDCHAKEHGNPGVKILAASRRGVSPTEDTIRKKCEASRGRIPWNKGLELGPLSEEHKKKLRAAMGKATSAAWAPGGARRARDDAGEGKRGSVGRLT
jgi:hypothetical protein